jgi:DNA-binding transcriptional MerR regulator
MPRRTITDPNAMRIGELADFLGVPRDRVKSWLRNGLITESQRIGKLRVWTLEDAEKIKARLSKEER